MKVACILVLSLVLVLLFDDCESWRRRRRRRFFRRILPRIRGRRILEKVLPPLIIGSLTGKRDALLSNQNSFVAKEVYDRYKSKKMQATLSGQQACVADDFNWRGDLVTLPCKYSAYDYTGVGYFYPADLAFHIKEHGRERDNMMVFKRLDQNGDGRVSESEFGNTKKHLLIDQETC